MIKSKKKVAESDNAEFGLDSRYRSKKERIDDGKTLMEARLKRMKKLSDDEIIKARLLQLKLKMEEFIKEPFYEERGCFTRFLTSYVDTIYDKRKSFAEDIEISPTLLSQILNNHKDPQEGFILRLMVHSERTYKNVCQFNEKTWYEVVYQDRLCEMMANQDEWKPNVEKFVHLRNLMKHVKNI